MVLLRRFPNVEGRAKACSRMNNRVVSLFIKRWLITVVKVQYLSNEGAVFL